MDKKNDKEVLNFFMEDSIWQQPKDLKQKEAKEPSRESEMNTSKMEINQNEKKLTEKENTIENNEKIKENSNPDQIIPGNEQTGFGEIDYAILKSITRGFKTIKEIANALQIRNLVIEKHIYKLIKAGFVKYFQFCVLTANGINAIQEFEKNNSEDIWKPIDEFIVLVIEKRKERNLKIQKTIDIVLVILVIVLIILIIYFGIF